MYYRRKLLLALLEVFGGNLSSTDCEKLLFNFCQKTGKNHYDFFPYRFGPFSFISYHDKRRLTDLGLLRSVSDFQLNTETSYLSQLEPLDQKALMELKQTELRGNRLVRKTYLEHPQFAARSEILEQMFNPQEIKHLQTTWNTDQTPIIFTTGYEGLTIDAFLNKLIAHNIMLVVDVRNNPQSMKYGFSKRMFREYLEKAGIQYIHIPELGIPSALRKGLGTSISPEQLFAQYATDLLPQQAEAIAQLENLIATCPRLALVCFEADHRMCHRHTLVEYLEKENTLVKPVVHL